jgi:hypothetical protein
MKWLSIGFFLFSLAAFSQPDTQIPVHSPNPNEGSPSLRPKTENELSSSPFLQCEKNISELVPKYFGKSKSHFSFQLMLACSGLEGDPIVRKGWKSYLPACPAEPPRSGDWKSDKDRFISQFHICADSCYRHSAKRSWQEIISEEKKAARNIPKNILRKYGWFKMISSEEISILNRHYPGQQCCYSRGRLVTDGPGAGTPDVIFMATGLTPKRLKRTGPLRAALFHDRFDVEIIKEKFSKWPQDWQDYWNLGWAPLASQTEKYWGYDSLNHSCERFQN